ncbi:MAG: hypothetical protein CME62_18240 [Halobacteriovoraceae bacterium]|nr:hypothetical protein [Halobacteriovoraceae bacterium]
MIILVILCALTLHQYREEIKGIDYYSFFIQKPNITYEFINEKDGGNLKFEPQISSFSGLAVGTEHLDITLAFKQQEEHEVKESQALDLQFSGLWKSYYWDLYYQNYQGLYLKDEESELILQERRSNAYSYGLGFKYFFNENYNPKKSLASHKKFNERKTAWSWLAGAFYNKNQLISHNQSFIPRSAQDDFSRINGLKSFTSDNYGIEYGIAGMYLWGNFHFSGLLSASNMLQYHEYSGIDEHRETRSSTGNYGFIDFGYSTQNKTFGINGLTQNISSEITSTQLNQSRTIGQFYYKYFF